MVMILKIRQYLGKEIWIKDLSNSPKSEFYLIKALRILIMSFKGFNEDKVELRSSALTYYSLLSIVPVLAMSFGIAKGFGMEEKLNTLLTEKLSAHQDIMNQVIDFANSMLQNTKGGVIAGVGVLLLFWSVLKVLGNIEESFNAIWGIRKGRNWLTKFTEYLSIMLIAPLLLILSSSLTVYISSKTKEMVSSIDFLKYVDSQLSFLLSLSPYLVFWLLLTMIYMIMPHTKVKFKSAFIAGVVAGSIFVVVQWAYVTFQIGVVKFNAIYGSFAALPLFLVWLRTSWIIVLFGAELSFVHQNVEQYILKEESNKITHSFRKKLSIYIVHYVILQFYKGESPTLHQLKKELKIPFRLAAQITDDLVNCHVLSRVENDNYKEVKLQPSIDSSQITIKFVLSALDRLGADEIPEPKDPTYRTINEKINALYNQQTETLIKDL